jgi:hypothetical protein
MTKTIETIKMENKRVKRNISAKINYNNNKDRISEYQREWRINNPDKMREQQKRARSKNKEYRNKYATKYRLTVNGSYNYCKHAAKRRKIVFNLTIQEYSVYYKNACNYCGGDTDTVRLDRIDSTLGYQNNNVVPCCVICNMMKNSHTTDMFLKHINKIYRHSIVAPQEALK